MSFVHGAARTLWGKHQTNSVPQLGQEVGTVIPAFACMWIVCDFKPSSPSNLLRGQRIPQSMALKGCTSSRWGMAAMECTSSVMRNAVGPARVHTQRSHSGPPSDTPSACKRGREQQPSQTCSRWPNAPRGRESYAFHPPLAHDERRAGRQAVGTVGDAARQRLALPGRRGRHAGLQQVFLGRHSFLASLIQLHI